MRLKKLLAVASGGGHWTQLLRLKTAFNKCEVYYVTTMDCHNDSLNSRCYLVNDASRWKKFGLLVLFFQMLKVFIRVRPDVVITTGAAPGVFAIFLGNLFCARTLWLDSIANAEEISLSGKLAGPHADLWLTQWPELVRSNGGPLYKGRVL